MPLREMRFFRKSDRLALAFLAVVAVVLLAAIVVTGRWSDDSATDADSVRTATSPSVAVASERSATKSYAVKPVAVRLTPFDPNTADSTQLLALGLQPYQVRAIYKYRAKGGIYGAKEDFARVPGLTLKKYRELEPYIRIAADYRPAAETVQRQEPKRDTTHYVKKIAEGTVVDINSADTAALKTVPGIGSYYARRITTYRERLGGYYDVGQLLEIDDFPAAALEYLEAGGEPFRKINVNKLSVNELKRHPYISYFQAKAIDEYRRTRGPLTSLDALALHKDFTATDIERLRHYVEF